MTGPGFFIVLEGPEGSGKSTLAGALVERMEGFGVGVVRVREPGGTPAAEAIRGLLLDHGRPIGPVAELFLVLAARAELVANVIRPALAAGRVVLSDRFDLSTRAYQVGGRGLDPRVVDEANRLASGGLLPDLTVLLDLDPELGLARQQAAGKRQDRLDRESREFHARVADVYLAATGPGVRHFDAAMPPDRLRDAVWSVLETVRPDTFRPRGR